jgi:hypothetical protein
MEAFYVFFGLAMIYSWIHFFVFSWTKPYTKRTDYEKVVTWVAMISWGLYVIGSST